MISIIIVNYNTCQVTKNCVDSIFNCCKANFEVILVDNHSTDNSKEAFCKDNRITYIYNQENLGFGKANNIGAKQAKGDYLFFLNSDTILLNDAVKYFHEFMDFAPTDIACCGCLLQGPNGKRCHSYGRFPTLWSDIKLRTLRGFLSKLHLYNSLLDLPEERKLNPNSFDVDYLTGADLLVRKDIADKYGLFDEDFFMYYEETEMQFRYHTKGLKSHIITTPQIIHLEGASDKPNLSKKLEKTIRNINSGFLYFKKTHSYGYYLMYRIGLWFFSLPKLFATRYPLSDRIKYYKTISR